MTESSFSKRSVIRLLWKSWILEMLSNFLLLLFITIYTTFFIDGVVCFLFFSFYSRYLILDSLLGVDFRGKYVPLEFLFCFNSFNNNIAITRWKKHLIIYEQISNVFVIKKIRSITLYFFFLFFSAFKLICIRTVNLATWLFKVNDYFSIGKFMVTFL